jgi:hypothetical protein
MSKLMRMYTFVSICTFFFLITFHFFIFYHFLDLDWNCCHVGYRCIPHGLPFYYYYSFHVMISPSCSESWSRFRCIITRSRVGNSRKQSATVSIQVSRQFKCDQFTLEPAYENCSSGSVIYEPTRTGTEKRRTTQLARRRHLAQTRLKLFSLRLSYDLTC